MKDTAEGGRLTHLIQGDDEGTLFLLQQVDRLERLRLQPVHDVHHQDGDVTQRAASIPQVTECKNKEQILRNTQTSLGKKQSAKNVGLPGFSQNTKRTETFLILAGSST